MVDLKSLLPGQVVFPFDPRYNRVRMDFNTRFQKFPLAIVFCRSVEDVIRTLIVARELKIPFRARWHCYLFYLPGISHQ